MGAAGEPLRPEISDGREDEDLPMWQSDVLAADGVVLRLRPLGPGDEGSVLAFYHQLSVEAVRARFFTGHLPPDDVLTRPIGPEQPDDFILAAQEGSTIVGIGGYTWSDTDQAAEVAFAVADDHQHRGIGTLLLEHLAARARDQNIERFHAHTLAWNEQMLDVFQSAGYRLETEVDLEDVHVSFVLDDAADDSISRREHQAEAASVRRLLAPETVAVIGASSQPGGAGHALFHNIISGGFRGTAHPVNRTASSVSGVPAYESIGSAPGPIDLAVIAVPKVHVAEVLEECGRAGVGAAVIVTAGFAERGDAGAASEEELVRIAHYHGMRIIGPNCIGIINTHPEVRLNATFSPVDPVAGNVSFASQSGALGIALLDHAARGGMGVASFVSLGNKADVSGNDLLQFWKSDPETAVGVLYLESFGNPRKFARLTRRFSHTKPLVVFKSGRSSAGQKAASSHTAALSSNDTLADAMFREAGIIRADTLSELFDVTRLLSQQPIPKGNRVAIVGNSGGPGILAADACETAGLVVAEFSPETTEELRALLPPGAGLSNPLDLIANARGPEYEAALDLILADDGVDAVIVIYTDPMISDAQDITAAIGRSVARNPSKPIVANFFAAHLGPSITEAISQSAHAPIPVYDFPEAAAVALGQAAALGMWQGRDHGTSPIFDDIDEAAASATVAEALSRKPEGAWLTIDEVRDLLEAYGIEIAPSIIVRTPDEAAEAAASIGTAVALKVVSPTIIHKTDVGGIRLGLAGPDETRQAYEDMAGTLGESMTGATVQPMVEPGVELIVGAVADPTFGPVVMFGAGGTTAELWADQAFGLAPLTDSQASRLVNKPRVSALLAGYRGSPAVNVAAIEELLLRLGQLVEAIPEVVELDMNPVIATPNGLHLVDTRCRVSPTQASQVRPRRRLSTTTRSP